MISTWKIQKTAGTGTIFICGFGNLVQMIFLFNWVIFGFILGGESSIGFMGLAYLATNLPSKKT